MYEVIDSQEIDYNLPKFTLNPAILGTFCLE